MSTRELIEPTPGDKRYVRRDEKGQFKEVDDVSRSLSQDVQSGNINLRSVPEARVD